MWSRFARQVTKTIAYYSVAQEIETFTAICSDQDLEYKAQAATNSFFSMDVKNATEQFYQQIFLKNTYLFGLSLKFLNIHVGIRKIDIQNVHQRLNDEYAFVDYGNDYEHNCYIKFCNSSNSLQDLLEKV